MPALSSPSTLAPPLAAPPKMMFQNGRYQQFITAPKTFAPCQTFIELRAPPYRQAVEMAAITPRTLHRSAAQHGVLRAGGLRGGSKELRGSALESWQV